MGKDKSQPKGGSQDKTKQPDNYVNEVKETYFNDFDYKVLLNMESADELDNLYDNIRKFLEEKGKDVTSSQLRNIYAKAKPIREKKKLKMLRPNLAYVIARQKNENAKYIMHWLDKLIQEVEHEKDPNEVEGFKKFFEAVVAYHKYFEESKKK